MSLLELPGGRETFLLASIKEGLRLGRLGRQVVGEGKVGGVVGGQARQARLARLALAVQGSELSLQLVSK